MVLCKGVACSNLPRRKKAMYNFYGMLPMYCKICIPDGDVMVDVFHRKCEEPGCSKQPHFGLEGGRAIFCLRHKHDNMDYVWSIRCEEPECNKHATFGLKGGRKRFCMNHKEDDMVDLMNKHCPGYTGDCPVRTRLTRNRKYCLSCDPDDSRRKRFKKYEDDFFTYVQDTLDIHQREYRVNFDSAETSKKCARIDGIVFGDGIIVCIEVDEDGHQEYECDEHRMHLVNGELLQKYPGNNIAWVRVNPTTPGDEQWSASAIKIRNTRFDKVIEKVNEVLMTKNTEIVYIGFTE